MDHTPDVPHGYPAVFGPLHGADDDVPTVSSGMGRDVGNDDKQEPTVGEAMSVAMAKQAELQTDLYSQGSTIGDLMNLPALPDLSTSASAGQTSYPGQATD